MKIKIERTIDKLNWFLITLDLFYYHSKWILKHCWIIWREAVELFKNKILAQLFGPIRPLRHTVNKRVLILEYRFIFVILDLRLFILFCLKSHEKLIRTVLKIILNCGHNMVPIEKIFWARNWVNGKNKISIKHSVIFL
jgi:hypothetical protein